ncbi:MAG TPA: hypothetical protein VFO78_02770, partial [Candidatus Limnocylindrales bacterium]|nr:hypothetical protein [Candidatus Limnocylindrales bacterium]
MSGARGGAGPGPHSGAGSQLRRWLTPGIGVKRWLLVVFAGELGLALAGALVIRQIYPTIEPS